MIVSHVERTADGSMMVDLVQLNASTTVKADALSAAIPAQLFLGKQMVAVTLERSDPIPAAVAVPPNGFAKARYRFQLPPIDTPETEAVLSLTNGDRNGFAFALSGAVMVPGVAPQDAVNPDAAASPVAVAALPPTLSAKPQEENAFLGNLSSYAPIYLAYGPGTKSDGRIQLSFKYKVFGKPTSIGKGSPFINGIHLGYTQRLFWDLGANSSPFRNVDYMPELFYLVPAIPVGDGFSLGGQAGYLHESNGRDGVASRSLNTVYVQPMATMPIGNYSLSIGPRLSFYTGSISDNPDIKRFRGNTGLFVEIGTANGLRLTTNSRYNFSSGKGATNAELSYPLDRIFASSLNLYVFGQAFAGYGENLLDYNRKSSRVRIGIGIVR